MFSMWLLFAHLIILIKKYMATLSYAAVKWFSESVVESDNEIDNYTRCGSNKHWGRVTFCI